MDPKLKEFGSDMTAITIAGAIFSVPMCWNSRPRNWFTQAYFPYIATFVIACTIPRAQKVWLGESNAFGWLAGGVIVGLGSELETQLETEKRVPLKTFARTGVISGLVMASGFCIFREVNKKYNLF